MPKTLTPLERELLEACKTARTKLSRMTHDNFGGPQSIPDTISLLDAAIARAESQATEPKIKPTNLMMTLPSGD